MKQDSIETLSNHITLVDELYMLLSVYAIIQEVLEETIVLHAIVWQCEECLLVIWWHRQM